MIVTALLIAVANPAYGPLIDRPSGRPCPVPQAGYSIYDPDAYRSEDELNTSPNMMTRCLRARQRLLDRRRPTRR